MQTKCRLKVVAAFYDHNTTYIVVLKVSLKTKLRMVIVIAFLKL